MKSHRKTCFSQKLCFPQKKRQGCTTQKTELGMHQNPHVHENPLKIKNNPITNLPSTIKFIPYLWVCIPHLATGFPSKKKHAGSEQSDRHLRSLADRLSGRLNRLPGTPCLYGVWVACESELLCIWKGNAIIQTGAQTPWERHLRNKTLTGFYRKYMQNCFDPTMKLDANARWDIRRYGGRHKYVVWNPR